MNSDSRIDIEELKDVLAALRTYRVRKASVGPYIFELEAEVPEPDDKTWNEQLAKAAEEAAARKGLTEPSEVRFG